MGNSKRTEIRVLVRDLLVLPVDHLPFPRFEARKNISLTAPGKESEDWLRVSASLKQLFSF